ncbi:hypothetical protein [Siphonobacter sp. SORGH_AS_1065]|uniref:hypothetical protein n=1 Tax=Siphonobacter sp. SORGH_AS_1065 TaxID=3041795 RepID=UPI002788C46F|nr:hypothetical protein [Siphonobacter sp. SORGH_AS_1065]MDQ1089006.1 hypothetical protein [Siphonobacter sp. SORGH_AS_1065]
MINPEEILQQIEGQILSSPPAPKRSNTAASIRGILSALVQWVTENDYTPEHEWDGTKIRFVRADGVPGPWIDLLGPQGIQGVQGVQGFSAYELWLQAGNTGSMLDYLNSIQQGKPLGPYNAATNTPALSAIAPAGPDGLFYEITEAATDGTPAAFAGINFTVGSKLFVGDQFVKLGTQWYRKPAANTGLQKSLVLENQINTMLPVYVSKNRIIPSSTYNYARHNVDYAEQRTWYFGKSTKKMNQVGQFIFKDIAGGSITEPGRLQVLWKRASDNVTTVLLDRTLTVGEMAVYNNAFAGSYSPYEFLSSLNQTIDFKANDVLFTSLYCASKLTPIYSNVNLTDTTGEWNDSAGKFYRGWNNNANQTYASIPNQPAAEINYTPAHFYERVPEFLRMTSAETRMSVLEAAKVTLATSQGTNWFDKATMLQNGKGIGNDSIVFALAGYASAIGVPVSESTQYVISGCQSLRGLRFEKSDGSLVTSNSYIGTIANGTPFVTPAGCVRISFQVYSNGSNADTVQLQLGSVVTPFETFVSYVSQNNGKELQAAKIKAGGTFSDGKGIADTASLAALAVRTTAAETAILANKITLGTVILVGKNKFNKALHYQSGKGIGSDAVVFPAADFGAAIGVPVAESTTYTITGCPSLRGLRFEKADGSLVNSTSYIGTINSGTAFTTPAGCVRISFQILSSASQNADLVQVELGSAGTAYEAYTEKVVVNKINDKELSGGQTVTTPKLETFEVLAPAYVYFTNKDSFTSRMEPVSLFAQRFIRDKVPVLLNGKDQLVISKDSPNPKIVNSDSYQDVLMENVSLSITAAGYESKNLTLNRISTRAAVLANKFPKVWYIGDSITADRQLNGAYVGGGSLWSYAKEIALKNRYDNGNTGYDYLCVGNNNGINSAFTYKGQNMSVRGYATGFGGWTTHGYLRHPFRFWVSTTQNGITYEGAKGAWDLLGLSTTQGRAYAATEADKLLIMKTCYGVNAPVISALSYNLLVGEGQIVNALGAWSGSADQINLVQAYIDGIANGTLTPQNPFFDYTKTGSNRFSVSKALERYRTLSDDGVTRLAVGNGAGTKVTNNMAYDVCTPTHFVIATGENDSLFSSSYAAIADDILELVTECRSQVPTVYVGVCSTQMPGPMFPERYPYYFGKFYQAQHNRKYDFYKELSGRFSTLANQVSAKTFLVPTFHTSTPASHSTVSEQVDDTRPGGVIEVGIDDYNHTGWRANRNPQIYGWVAYTYSLWT